MAISASTSASVVWACCGSRVTYWINAGVYVFDRCIVPQLPELGDHEVETFPQLAQAGKISALKSQAFWRSVDSFKDLREAEEHLRVRS